MKYDILKENITQKEHLLLIQLKIGLYNINKNERIRLVAVFRSGEEDRTIVCHTESTWNEHSKDLFIICQQKIELPFVFFHELETDTVTLHFEIEQTCCTTTLFPTYNFDSTLFKRKKQKHSHLRSCVDNVAFAGCTFLLPFLLLDGAVKSRGNKPLDTGENTVKTGKKAIFYHANAIVKRACNRSYSPREWKTAYLNECYEKEKKKPIKKKQVLFLSERPFETNSNLALISEKFREDTNSDITTVLYTNTKTIDKLSFLEIHSIAKLIAQSSLIILEDFYPQLHFLTLRKETRLVQLWHACGAFKTFGFSRLDKAGGPTQRSMNHRSYDYTFVSGKRIQPIYAEAFGIPMKNVLPLGVPRTDYLFDDAYKTKKRRELFEDYPVLKGKKVVLFAPTFRGHGNKDAFYPVEKFHVDKFMEQLPKDTILLLKNHPFVKQSFPFDEKWSERILDFSNCSENINDLLLVTDLLITDYSSVIFEASLLHIPMLFYAFDQEEYLESRDIYYDFDTFIPGPVLKTEAALSKYTNKMLTGSCAAAFSKQIEHFISQYLEILDGKSADRIYSFLKTLL